MHPQHRSAELRIAYKNQTTKNGNDNELNHNMFDNNDQHSSSGVSAANSSGTPSSVYMPSSVALSRDVSDISGISGGTSRGSSSHNIPGQIFDSKSLTRPWNQAYNLSKIPPEHQGNVSSSSACDEKAICDGQKNIKNPSIWVAENDVVEIFDNLESSLGLDRFQIMRVKHNRIPIMILLMDPSKQVYELMQIWVDRSNDSVRDLIQVLQHKLPVNWKKAYDGLFQVRGHRFTQLINIIRLVKYDIQAHEILIAKPWSMAAKVAIAIAGSAIRHLTRIGVIATDNDDSYNSDKDRHRHRRQQLKTDDTPLLLSKRAQDRAYFPEGILDHHHAIQFVTFSPPFESDDVNDTPSYAQSLTPTNPSPFDSSSLKSMSVSQCDKSSSLLGSDNDDKCNSGTLTLGIRRVLAGHRSRRQRPSQHSAGSDRRSNNNDIKPTEKLVTPDNSNVMIAVDHQLKSGENEFHRDTRMKSNRKQYYVDDSSCGPVGCFSKFNCLRNSNHDAATKARNARVGVKTKPFPQTPMASLSEEDEKRWLAYSMKPIDEDQSLATRSIVSMSAPLLPPVSSHLINIINNNNKI